MRHSAEKSADEKSADYRALLAWLSRYTNGRGDALLLWPGIVWNEQPACTEFAGKGVKGQWTAGTVTPQAWTRTKLRYWGRLLSRFVRGEYDKSALDTNSPKMLQDRLVLTDAEAAFLILTKYREMVEGEKDVTP